MGAPPSLSPAPPPPMGWPGSPCRGMGRPGGARAAAAQDGGTAAGPGNGGAGRGWRECGGRWGRLGPRTPQSSPCGPCTPRTRPPVRRRRAATGARARTSGADGGRRGSPLGPAQRGRYLLRDHQTDPRPGAQVLPLPPVLPGGPGAGLGQGAPRPRARPRVLGPILGWCSDLWDTFPSSGSCKPGLQSSFCPRVSTGHLRMSSHPCSPPIFRHTPASPSHPALFSAAPSWSCLPAPPGAPFVLLSHTLPLLRTPPPFSDLHDFFFGSRTAPRCWCRMPSELGQGDRPHLGHFGRTQALFHPK